MAGFGNLFRAILPTVLLLCLTGSSVTGIKITKGHYQNIVVGVDSSVPTPTDIETFRSTIEKILNEASAALHYATDQRASFSGDVTLILPRTWTGNTTNIESAGAEYSIHSSNILLHGEANTLPDTLQVEQCGVPGRQIRLPFPFLEENEDLDEQKKHGSNGKVIAHEWGHFRYGVQDEHGFGGDPVYNANYSSAVEPTSCINGTMEGTWFTNCNDENAIQCKPGTSDCFFCVKEDATPDSVKASLGYLPALSTGKFCTAETHNSDTPSPQNLMCGGLSITEVINAHPDAVNMEVHSTPGIVNVILKEEPLPRVAFILDVPCTNSSEARVDYNILVDQLEKTLTIYNRLQLTVISYWYRGMNDSVDIIEEISTIASDYSSLKKFLPDPVADCVASPDLAEVLPGVMEILGDYNPGTMLILPFTKYHVESSMLTEDLGNDLHRGRMKPLFLFAESSPSLVDVSSFLQYSGSKFLLSNGTDGSSAYTAAAEVGPFVQNTFMNDHSIIMKEVQKMPANKEYENTMLYQSDVAKQLIAVITSTKPITELTVQYQRITGVWSDCDVTMGGICTHNENTIMFKFVNEKPRRSPGLKWSLKVINNGKAAASVTITWSQLNIIGVSQELDVEVWSSEEHGPIAELPQNSQLSLYASVSSFGYQVLGERIQVFVDVSLLSPSKNTQPEKFTKLEFLDNGEDMDTRKDDSVFSFNFANKAPWLEKGTNITIEAVYINSYGSISGGEPSFPEKSEAGISTHERRSLRSLTSENVEAMPGNEASGPRSKQLYTTDPGQTECCGSFVEKPYIHSSHKEAGFNVYLWNTFDTVTITRNIERLDTTTTTTTSTTTPSTTTPSTTTPSTTTTTPSTTTPSTTTTPATTTTTPSTTPATTTTDGATSLSITGPWIFLGAMFLLMF